MSLLDPGNGLNGLAQFIATAVIVLFVLAAGWTILRPSEPRQRRFRTRYQPSRPGLQQAPDLKDVGQQLLAVMACSFQPRRVLSRSEYRVFKIVEDYAAVARRGYRVLAQTSLGEILRSTNPNAFRSINSKRVDILVIDRGGWPVLAVEFQGQAHYQGTAAARDAIKKEALRKAGVRYLEVFAADSDEQIQTRVREQLG